MKTQLKAGILSCLTASLLLAGCRTPEGNPNYTGSGALAGGATGALIGSTTHHGTKGTVVGGLIGTAVGTLAGWGLDQRQENQLRTGHADTVDRIEQGQPLTLSDVKALSNSRVSDNLIISQIRNSLTVYHLSPNEILDLKNSGVSEGVIDAMINTPSSIMATPPPPIPPPPAARRY